MRHLTSNCTYTEQFWKLAVKWFKKQYVHARSLKITKELGTVGVQNNLCQTGHLRKNERDRQADRER